MVLGYFFLWFLIPKYLQQGRHKIFGLYSVYTFIIGFFFIVLSVFYGFIFSNHLQNNQSPPITKGLIFVVLGVYMVVLLIIVLGLIQMSYQNQLKDQALKSKFLQADLQLKEQELKYLKMQIHPHFLFNTLNTIYGFSLKKAEQTPEMILKLSGLLDYILYQINKPAVPLKEEIKHIRNYIDLEKMRFRDRLSIQINESNIETTDVFVPPMLFLPFIENAFKHGDLIDQVLHIEINFLIKDSSIFFDVRNSILPNRKQNINGGIGLKNIQDRLQMHYKDRYTLELNENKEDFFVQLKIPINE
jgi:LytS/YehU family sensor histidine kinase